jgi:hypothetical protein
MEQSYIIIGLLLIIMLLIWWTRREHEVATIWVNGTPVRVNQSPYGVYTSGADLRDQVQFTGTDQGRNSLL